MRNRPLSWQQIVAVVLLVLAVFLVEPRVSRQVDLGRIASFTAVIFAVSAGLLLVWDWRSRRDTLIDVLALIFDRELIDSIGDGHMTLVGRQVGRGARLFVFVQNARGGAGGTHVFVRESGLPLPGLAVLLRPAEVLVASIDLPAAVHAQVLHIDFAIEARCTTSGPVVRSRLYPQIENVSLTVPLVPVAERCEQQTAEPVNAVKPAWRVASLWSLERRCSLPEILKVLSEFAGERLLARAEEGGVRGTRVLAYRSSK